MKGLALYQHRDGMHFIAFIDAVENESFWTGARRNELRDPRSQSRDLGHPFV
jgi:hypothetical protein